jgi:hypothetical protein
LPERIDARLGQHREFTTNMFLAVNPASISSVRIVGT